MQKFIETVEGENGRPVPGASITVYNAGTSTPATIYLSNGGAATANPLTADSTGMFYFYAADGRYDLLVSYAGATRTIYDILLEDPVDANVINATTLTATTGTIGTLNSTTATLTSATIPTLASTTATLTSATVPTLGSTTATISNGTVTTLASTNATVTALNAVSATVTTLTATSPNFTSVGVGGAPTTAIGIHHRGSATGATTAYGMLQNNTVQSDVTSSYRGIQISTGTQATSFTLSNLYGTHVSQATFGAGSTVTNQYGHYVDSSMTGAANNYGYFSGINSGAGRYNFYAAGDADNYLGGRLGIKTTANNGGNIEVGGVGSFSGTSGYGISQYQTIPSSVTNQYWCNTTVPSTTAAAFTLLDLRHYNASQGTIGAGSSITNQYGFYVGGTLTGATNNYGFYAAIPSGSNRWNFYATGTALNHFNGRSLFGTTTDDGTNQIQSAGHIATTVAGQGFKVKEGSNAKMGTATLVAGTVTVSNTSVTANSRIFLTSNADGGIPGFLRVSARSASTSFTITSSSGTDTSTVAWLILEPA